MTGGWPGDDGPVIPRPCAPTPVACETLGTNGGGVATHLTCPDRWLSTIHRPYYHHLLLLSILSGESERLP